MRKTTRMRGISASRGIAIGPARIIDRQEIKLPKRRVSTWEVQKEVDRLMEAVEISKKQLVVAKEATEGAAKGSIGDHSMILDAHLLMLQDEMLINGASEIIRSDYINAEWAFSKKVDEIRQTLVGLGDIYFSERANDVDFVSHRVLRNLMGHATEIMDKDFNECIVVADSLSPVETTQMVGSSVLGFTTEGGTRTSHTAIMAQALGIPAVVGVEGLTERLGAGEPVIIDGNNGVVIIRPDEETIRDYEERQVRHFELEKKLLSEWDQPAVTRDGERITLLSNIEFPAEAAMAIDYGAEGIGLYRTEFMYMNRREPPDEEEQFNIYKTVVGTMLPKSVVFRTFDLGADKMPSQGKHREANPALGLRAIRLGLRNRSMFKTQLRALLRSAEHGQVEIMFPMITGVSELRQVKALLKEAARELKNDLFSRVRIGCMIEVPSAVIVADQLAREVDFFSIGTNDLIQYALAIDRVNDHVAYLYTPFHPAILRAVEMVINAGKNAGISVAMCGSLAAEPLLIPLLLGLGLRIFSMAPTSIPIVKAMIRTIDSSEARKLAEEAMRLPTAVEIEDLVRHHVENKLDPDFPSA